ncbi:DUF3102 domain-containing protein [Methylocystis sp. IM3]|uniref:DUF3102 domain-containing protein n=1 Tax=unclassified Methylocystis TaxID=2625913 RepID=UPI0030F9B1D7
MTSLTHPAADTSSAISNMTLRETWAERITAAWQKSVASILETGHNLIQAKQELEHGEWLKMIKDELPFGEDTAERLMKVARNPVLSNSDHGRNLPASYQTLYELAKLPDDLLEKKIESGEITPRTERKDVVSMRGEAPKASASGRSGVVKHPELETQLAADTKVALEEATDWIKTKAEGDDMPVETIISWFEQFESEQLIAMLRKGSADEAVKRPIIGVLRHYKTEYGATKVDAAWAKIVRKDAALGGSSVKRKPSTKTPTAKKPTTKKSTTKKSTTTTEKVAEDTEIQDPAETASPTNS